MPRPIALLAALALAGCGGSSAATSTSTTTTPPPHRVYKYTRVTLRESRALSSLPAARSGIAAAKFGQSIIVIGGLSDAGESTATVFQVRANGPTTIAPQLPSPVHDAAATDINGRLLLFGGGRFEGSDRIVSVLPGAATAIGTLPQPLSDLDAATIGGVAYVVGGWNGSTTNRDVYEIGPDGRVRTAGSLPTGVRYPAAAALAGRLIVAGGELSDGTPTAQAWSFDPASGQASRIPDLPVPTDHAAAASIDGRFYLLGGLRRGTLTRAIVSWAPGETRWRRAGLLPRALADAAAVPFDGGIAVIGGRTGTKRVSNVTLMTP